MTKRMITILINCLFPMLAGEEGQGLLFDLVHVMRAFMVDLDLDLLPPLLPDHLTTPNKKSPPGPFTNGGDIKSGLQMEVDEMGAGADADAEAEAEL